MRWSCRLCTISWLRKIRCWCWQSIRIRLCSYDYLYFVLLEVQLLICVSFWTMFTLNTVLNDVGVYESMYSVYTIIDSIERRLSFLCFSYAQII